MEPEWERGVDIEPHTYILIRKQDCVFETQRKYNCKPVWEKGSGLKKKKTRTFHKASRTFQNEAHAPSPFHSPFYSQTVIRIPKINQADEQPEKNQAPEFHPCMIVMGH